MSAEIYTYFDAEMNGDVAELKMTSRQLRHPEPAQTFRREVLEVLERHSPRAILIDMKDTDYMGSTAFAALMTLKKRLDEVKVPFVLCDLHPDVQLASQIVGLGRVMGVYEDRKEARKALEGAEGAT